MFDLVIDGTEYTNVVYKDEEYLVQRTGDGKHHHQKNRYRLVNTYGDEENHTHLNSMDKCKECIELVRGMKIPRTSNKYFIVSCYRLSTDEGYRDKVMDLYERKRDRQRQKYIR